MGSHKPHTSPTQKQGENEPKADQKLTGKTAEISSLKGGKPMDDERTNDQQQPDQRPDQQRAPRKDPFSRRQDKSLANILNALDEKTRAVLDRITPMVNTIDWDMLNAVSDTAKAVEEYMNPTLRKVVQTAGTLPYFDDVTMRKMGDSLRKSVVKQLVLMKMVHRWEAGTGMKLLDDDDEGEAVTRPDGEQETIDTEEQDEGKAGEILGALQDISSAYVGAHGDIQLIVDDDGASVELPPAIVAEVNSVIDDYISFHTASGIDSYEHTATEFAKNRFSPRNTPSEIVVSDRLSAISRKEFQAALQTRPNPTAFIAPLGTGMMTQFKWDEEHQQVINAKTKEPVQQSPTGTAMMMKTAADAVQTPDFILLTTIYSILLSNAERFDGDRIVVPLSKFGAAAGIDLTAGNAKNIEAKFAAFESFCGWINGEGLFSVLKFIERDDVQQTITFSAPYLHRLLSMVREKSTRAYSGGRTSELGHNHLVHTAIYSERNQTAAALVVFISNLLLQNRQQPDQKMGEAEVIINVRFSTLAEYAELDPRIQRMAKTREKTRTLRATFTKAFELLRTKSDCYQYYDGLELFVKGADGKRVSATINVNGKLLDNVYGKEKFNVAAPTFKEYNSVLYIRHTGRKATKNDAGEHLGG